jgi:hypothetical protein
VEAGKALDEQADVAPEIVNGRRVEGAAARSRRRRLVIQVAAAVVALALIGWAILALTGGSTPSTLPSGGPGAPSPGVSPTVPGRPLFFFPIEAKQPAVTGKPATDEAQNAAIEIGGRLSPFYDTVFMDPSTWGNGVPDTAWGIFDPSILDRVKGDAAAFTLGDGAADIAKLSVDESSLAVKVLLDPKGHPADAVAEVTFKASGELKDGLAVSVTNHASLLLRVEGGQWFVVGYPSATTNVQTASASASPTPSGSASP